MANMEAPAHEEDEVEVPDLGRLTHTTAMCWAAAEGDVALMQRLRALGVDVNAADYDKRCVSLVLFTIKFSCSN